MSHLEKLAWMSVIAVTLLGRVLLHIPNVGPLLGFTLLLGWQMQSRLIWPILLSVLIVSDLIIGWGSSYGIFGSWTFFTYSGYAALLALSRSTQAWGRWRAACVIPASFGYWLWTNFGVWLMSGMYPHTGAGLATCFTAALPFLRQALIGDITWSLIFILSWQAITAARLTKTSIQVKA